MRRRRWRYAREHLSRGKRIFFRNSLLGAMPASAVNFMGVLISTPQEGPNATAPKDMVAYALSFVTIIAHI
jgi:hypothetical protein